MVTAYPQLALGRRLLHCHGSRNLLFKTLSLRPASGQLAFRQDGSVVIYDYGGVKTLSNDVVHHFRQLIHAARAQDIAEIEQHLDALQAISALGKFPEDLYLQWLEVLMRPLTTHYDFAENSAHHDGVELVKSSLKYWDVFKPSPDTLMVNQLFQGIIRFNSFKSA